MHGQPPRGYAPPPGQWVQPPLQAQQQQQQQLYPQQQFNHHHFQNPVVNNIFQNPNFLSHYGNLQWQNPVGLQPPPPPPPPPPGLEQSQPQGLEQSQPPRPKPTVHVNPDFGLKKCSRAVMEARRETLASGESVSAWKVSQAALVKLKADSWESLGFQMKQVPALQQTMAIEAKINTFIHCFVEVRKFTSLYDLELAICENEGVQMFEELELGPLVRHPLVLRYFQVGPDIKEAFRIRSEELIAHLHEFLHAHPHKEVKVDKFLDYIAEKRSLACKEKLTVRIQSLGWHVSLIRSITQLEATNKRKLKEKYGIIKDRPLLSLKKENLDERFRDMSQHLKSPSLVAANFCGKHIRFLSSSDDDYDCEDEDNSNDGVDTKHKAYQHGEDDTRAQNLSSQLKRADRVSRCPYPSVSEEMTRLGLKHQVGKNAETDIGNDSEDVKSSRNKRKRKMESICNNDSSSLPSKLTKGDKKKVSHNKDCSGGPDVSESTKAFITTWKETCRDNSVEEVINRMWEACPNVMKKRMKKWFFKDPFHGLLDVAVQSIKCGLWDSMYDTFKTFKQEVAINSTSDEGLDYITVEDESDGKDAAVSATKFSKHEKSILIDDIIKKIISYFCQDDNLLDYTNLTSEKRFSFLRKLHSCESWLIEQFSLKDFGCLGYGDFFMFLEKYLYLLPNGLKTYLVGEIPDNRTFEVFMRQLQLDVLLSQVSSRTCDHEKISKKMILELLRRQFPSVCLESGENDYIIDFKERLRTNVANNFSDSVIFSATLLNKLGTGGSDAPNENVMLDLAVSPVDIKHNAGSLGHVTSKDAIDVLLRAPMLIDLDHWAHWDLIFAPSLGSLVLWLLNEVNIGGLLCLVTKGGIIVRLDPSVTVEAFFEALIEGSSFKTALKLLSLLAIYGGERNVPLSLLKCHAQKAFKVFLDQTMKRELDCSQNCIMHGVPMPRGDGLEEYSHTRLSDKLWPDSCLKEACCVSSRFFLDCLGYLPTEFHCFAVSVLLAGLQTVIRDAPSAILSECKTEEHRIILHEAGISLGILEWINDYHSFRSSAFMNPIKTSRSNDMSYNLNGGAETVPSAPKDVSSTVISVGANQNDNHKEDSLVEGIAEVLTSNSSDVSALKLSKPDDSSNSNKFIEAIRRDEFGLDSNLSPAENNLLMKQHTRLGRALHCLSQELYSQDSHFLLELVQNADDNSYPQSVEPSLTFILQDKGIVVLNNEIGFSAENIRALCDVGSSTKRDMNAGYIGKKGIGFKSVFRVTDAPEIHSSGFHIKFDITEGQIGFVLPTVVPPCDISYYSRLISMDNDKVDSNYWKTCIILPFKANFCQGLAMNNIVSMFSDLHPSLLLFLHRLQCIKLRNMVDSTMVVMRKEVGTDGIVNVSVGKEKMAWLVASQKLQASVIRPDAKETEISLAFTLEETGDGGYVPLLHQQPVFAFLPLRTYGLKFILQGDFVVPSSREEVDGNSPWNQWILSQFPDLFVTAQKSFSDLPSFRANPAKAVTAFMSFVPLMGEVHGFFSSLPRMIISKLCMSKCLLMEADNEWVLPCKVLRNWDERARALLPDNLLLDHLGMGWLRKDILLSDALARALGVEEYGPKTLLHVMESLSRSENGLRNMGLGWLSTWISEIYLMSHNFGNEFDLIVSLKKIPFIPLSDGKYCTVDKGTIWLHCVEGGAKSENNFGTFSKLYAKLRTVNPVLFSAERVSDNACMGASVSDNVERMLIKVGVQRLTAHEIVKAHILPAICGDQDCHVDKDLLTEYLSFLMFHLQSSCPNCSAEREWIMDHLRSRALIYTNYGHKQLNKELIHFSKEFGNPIDISRLIDNTDLQWLEIDSIYLKHPVTKSVSDGMFKWRSFFLDLGITDFVKVVQVEKCIEDLSNSSLNIMELDGGTSMQPITKDWESGELVKILSQLSSGRDCNRCKYLLEILDMLWDDSFSDKDFGYSTSDSCQLGKPFVSSFIVNLQNVKWMVSTMDEELHYPKDLFYDCDQVRSVLGDTVPYATPKVRSQKLLQVLGIKSVVRLDDALSILQVWRRSETPFKASISQMVNLYTFIWNEMAASKPKILEQISSAPFIFIPHVSGSSPKDIVTGSLLSAKEVFWFDTTGIMDQIKMLDTKCGSDTIQISSMRMLQSLYPTLHDFFVKECGVEELPSIDGHLQILIQLSKFALPSQVARAVFNVFTKWADQLKCGSMSDEAIELLSEKFKERECTVLPSVQDKWVSLHPSFGLICWSDDDKLRREFKNLNGVDLLYSVGLLDKGKQYDGTSFATLMKRLGVPSLSSVVTREAIYYGPTDSSFKSSVVNWALPYAQRYMFHLHPDRYLDLKQSGLEHVGCTQLIVVEKLYYKNVINGRGIKSQKRFECSCLLQGSILYVTQQADSHSMFLELSRAFFDGVPELHLANFLHMITTMTETGSTQEQTELFILNNQKVPELPEGESIWSLSSTLVTEKDELEISDSFLKTNDVSNSLNKTRRMPGISSCWPPVDWKTAPGFGSVKVSKNQAGSSLQISDTPDASEFNEKKSADCPPVDSENASDRDVAQANSLITEACESIHITETEFAEQSNIPGEHSAPVNLQPKKASQDARVMVSETDHDPGSSASNRAHTSVDPVFTFDEPNLNFGSTISAQAILTGRMGELVAYKYFVGKAGEASVKWVNESSETGLPYDILIEHEKHKEYIEVKATRSRSATRNLAFISTREWQFGCEKKEAFSIAHVTFLDDNSARVTVYKNPVKLCQLGMLRLAVIIPKPQQQ